MIQALENFIQSIITNIRIVDIMDIALASCIFYFFLNWVRQNISGRTFIGISILFVIYAGARFTGMYLTEALIEALFFIFFIGAIIIFRSDIHRLLDKIGSWKIFGKKSSSSTYNTTNIITEAAALMANEKIGALMVIKGKDSWERQTHGGINLNGKVSVPLLKSIFNPKAPGHDGAVLIEENIITRFSVHLPLSTRLNEMATGGTRHAAALGMSEQCDALVVVVSEESGAISVARDGYIKQLDNNSELKEQLDQFWETHYRPTTNKVSWWKKNSPRTAFSAIILAIILWLAFVFQPGTVYRTYEVPIEYRNVSKKTSSLQESMPVTIRITLSGPGQAFENFNADHLVISFNLKSKKAKDGVLEITNHNLNLPRDIHLYEADPKELYLDTEQ